jgi:hypothetical protein
MAAMGSKSREVIYGGRIIGAKIRADGACEAAQKAVREAHRASAGAMVDSDGSLWRTGAALSDDRAVPQWRLHMTVTIKDGSEMNGRYFVAVNNINFNLCATWRR